MHRTLIIARWKSGDSAAVADIFGESDATDLPHLIGVSRRTLFSFHDLYIHSIEADGDIAPNLYRARSHPLYQDINTRLTDHVHPYDPAWAEPKDAMAKPFYVWTAESGRVQ